MYFFFMQTIFFNAKITKYKCIFYTKSSNYYLLIIILII